MPKYKQIQSLTGKRLKTITKNTNFFPDQPTSLENIYVAYEADETCILDFQPNSKDYLSYDYNSMGGAALG